MTDSAEDDLAIAREVISIERDALGALTDSLGASFKDAIDLILAQPGYVIIAGVGKSGHIGQKIAASLASTGTPAFFLHPTEASHGDLGMVVPGAVVLAISYSGESNELIDLLRFCRGAGVPVIGMTRSETSRLGRGSDVLLQMPVHQEACPNGLAPTSSTTMTLALGDALAVALMARRGFSREDFGSRHPGGKLGKSLHTIADYLADRDDFLPLVSDDSSFETVVQAIAEGRQGCVGVVDTAGHYVGIITDGDLRRAMAPDAKRDRADQMMTPGGTTFLAHEKIALVVDTLTRLRISNGFVLQDARPIGMIHIKDLLAEGYL
ncbi:MAG: KpsF/GutQ family sugar-phosphate isomerase [Pseudomonadota bacterium]